MLFPVVSRAVQSVSCVALFGVDFGTQPEVANEAAHVFADKPLLELTPVRVTADTRSGDAGMRNRSPQRALAEVGLSVTGQ